MSILLLLCLCGHIVQYSHGYVTQGCNHVGDCEINEFCWDRGIYSICMCAGGYEHEVGGKWRKHCATSNSNCVYDEDCSFRNQSQPYCGLSVTDNGTYYHQCKCSGLYYISRPHYDGHYECVLHSGVYVGVGVGVAVLVVILIVVKRRRDKRRERQSLSPQPQIPHELSPQQPQQQQQQQQQPQPQPHQHDDGKILNNDRRETHHVYMNSGFSGASDAPPNWAPPSIDAPPDYNKLFPDTK